MVLSFAAKFRFMPYFDRVTFPGHGFCLPRIPFVLIAKSGFDGASPTRVAFVDARDERLASLRFSRQGLLEHLYDVARRQQLQARLLGHALFYYTGQRQKLGFFKWLRV